MIFPTLPKFKALAQQGNFVPVYQEWVADLDTPVSAWYKVCAGQPYSFLLESVEGGERLGRYSFLGCDPLWTLEARNSQTIQTLRDGRRQVLEGNPFEILTEQLAGFEPVHLPQLPPGIGGLFGFWGYELIRWIEPTVTTYPAQADDLPDGLWMQVDSLLIFDQVRRKIWAVGYADLRDCGRQDGDVEAAYEAACDRVRTLISKLQQPLTPQPLSWQSPETNPSPPPAFTSNQTEAQYCTGVEKAKDYIRVGDIFQVVPSQ